MRLAISEHNNPLLLVSVSRLLFYVSGWQQLSALLLLRQVIFYALTLHYICMSAGSLCMIVNLVSPIK